MTCLFDYESPVHRNIKLNSFLIMQLTFVGNLELLMPKSGNVYTYVHLHVFKIV